MDLFDGYFMDLFGGCLDLLVEFWTLDVLWVFKWVIGGALVYLGGFWPWVTHFVGHGRGSKRDWLHEDWMPKMVIQCMGLLLW